MRNGIHFIYYGKGYLMANVLMSSGKKKYTKQPFLDYPQQIFDSMMYNTQLDPQKEQDFQSWSADRSNALGRDVMRDQSDYDLRGDFIGGSGLDGRGHGSDVGKKPNHPTFSESSKYSTAGQEGGRWSEGDNGQQYFTPSPHMMQDGERMNNLQSYLLDREKGVNLLSPYIAQPKQPDAPKNRLRNTEAIISDGDGSDLLIHTWPQQVRSQYLKHTQDEGNNALSAKQWSKANPEYFKGTSLGMSNDPLRYLLPSR